MRLAIGVITANDFPAPNTFWESFIALTQRIGTGTANRHLPNRLQISAYRWIRSQKFPTDVARNEICAAVLAGEEDALLFLDADMVHPPELVERLLFAEQPVVTARYHVKSGPEFGATVYVKHRTIEGPGRYDAVNVGRGLFEVERCGAGALLIRREVLQAIYDRVGHNWFRYRRSPDPPHDFSVSEDFEFCRLAREAGFSIWCDWETECGHIKPMEVRRDFNDAFLLRLEQLLPTVPPEERRRIANSLVVCGIPEGITLSTGEHVPCYQVTPGER